METELIIVDETKEFETNGGLYLERAKAFAVTDDTTYIRCQELIKGGKKFISDVKAFMNGDIKKADELHKSLTGKRKKLIAPVEKAVALYNGESTKYFQEVERKRHKEEALLAEESRKTEEENRRIEEDKRLSEAQAAEERGEKDLADAILETPLQIPPAPPPVAKTAVPVIPGVSHRKDFIATLIDFSKVELGMLMQDVVKKALESAAKKLAVATDGKKYIPGFKITETQTQVNRK